MPVAKKVHLPILVEKDEDGFYVVECPLLQGCYTQGKNLDEALKNIHEVIELCLEEQKEELVKHLERILKNLTDGVYKVYIRYYIYSYS